MKKTTFMSIRHFLLAAATATATGLSAQVATQTLNYTGSVQSFTVPAGVTSITIDARGAQGGGGIGGSGGLGARMVGTYSVTPGQVLSVVVGQQGLQQVGGNSQNSSGGGGGSFVYLAGGSPTLFVAAGGGGGRCNYSGSPVLHAGAAGTVVANGNASNDGYAGGTGGLGGSQSSYGGGGTGWLGNGNGPSGSGGQGYNTWTGGLGLCCFGGGGNGGAGGFGGGGGGGNAYGGGGGGGGYSGGGAGGDPNHGGGGGSLSNGTNQSNTSGYQSGDGVVMITYPTCTPAAAPTNTTPVANQTLCAGNTTTLSATGSGTINWYTVPSGGTVVATGTTIVTSTLAAGNYTFYAEATNTCAPSPSRTAVSLTVNASPAITANSGSICAGQSFTIVPGGAATYTISGGNAVVTPTANASYSVTGTSSVGCVSSSPAISMVTVAALPAVNASSSSSVICTGQSATLTATGAGTYSWSTGAATSTVNVTPTVNTTYTVVGTSSVGCSASMTITQNVSSCTGLNEQAIHGGMKIYPNPNSGEFVIEATQALHVVITNVLGQEILSAELHEGKNLINLINQPKGIYFVRTAVNGSEQRFSLIKE
jgi:hypothetical protein